MHPHLTPALSPPSEGAEREKICGLAVASPYHGSTSREGVGLFHEFAAGPFDVALYDAAGRRLLQKFVTATSGSGTRGTYETTLTFSDALRPRWLEVFEPSAENGRPLHKVRIPLNG